MPSTKMPMNARGAATWSADLSGHVTPTDRWTSTILASSSARPTHGSSSTLLNADCGRPCINAGWLRQMRRQPLTTGRSRPLATAATRMMPVGLQPRTVGTMARTTNDDMNRARPWRCQCHHEGAVRSEVACPTPNPGSPMSNVPSTAARSPVRFQPSKSSSATAVASGVARALEKAAPARPSAKPTRPPTPMTPSRGATIVAIWKVWPGERGAAEATSMMSRLMVPVRAADNAMPSCIRVLPLAIEEPSKRLRGTAVVPIRDKARGAELSGMDGISPEAKASGSPTPTMVAEKQRSIIATSPVRNKPMR
mmetsp:Transcript_34977/g.91855  ORF Transcript_34977/g.91855 Transcript_34977/m.91855 type:complete len:310 (-) Transcript_34977:409-1338(-)